MSKHKRNQFKYGEDFTILSLALLLICLYFKVIWTIIKYTYISLRFIYTKIKEFILKHKYEGRFVCKKDLKRYIENMTPREYEVFISEMYKQNDYDVELTAASNDYGRDVIVSKDGITTYIECKHYKKHEDGGSLIGREICQKLLGSCVMFNVNNAIIYTTGDFHENAYECERMVSDLKLMDLNATLNYVYKNEKIRSNLVFILQKTFKDRKYIKKELVLN